ncbi:MAG: ATPase, T2SS/T4P/T4SS family [Candidatus Moraniibacteriota bacterium]
MQIQNDRLKTFLLDSNMVPADQLETIFQEAETTQKPLGKLLLERKLIEESSLQRMSAYVLGIPFVDLKKQTVDPDVLEMIPELVAKKSNVVAFEKSDGNLKVAMLHPEDLQTIDFIKKKTGLRIVPCLTTQESIAEILKQYNKSLEAEFTDIVGFKIEESKDEVEGDLEKMADGLPVVRVVETLLKHAILQSASDIHIEPAENSVIVRYRIDGVLHDAMSLPKESAAGIVARIKVLANLKLDEHRSPQDGRFKINAENIKTSFRVSVLPVFDGEKVVMRLLNEGATGLTLEKMGIHDEALEKLHRDIKKPNGMILVTGPTGSGKTTTLYTVLDILNTAEVNISTVEDPVEYRMPRVNQTQINPKVGMTFAAALRSLLRQDPDIIMVGEIRDEETLEIALNAAMTGHLVLSTLHTNNAAAALPRMLDMGAEPFLIASTVNVIVAQRLVRRLCPECHESYTLEPKQVASFAKQLPVDDVLAYLKKILPDQVAAKAEWTDIPFFRSKGCDQCGGEGYHGRLGIYEVLEMTTAIRKLVTEGATSETIDQAARDEGMTSMVQDGFFKMVQGITSLEEILRVTKE